ncbi:MULTISPECIES: histidinol-phosphate transaminase [unclassified Vibrio]|uniref:histidinol-phosphate transaminase n=1 Tax=Vibrio sp. HB236076 TaxID=3232307 RepID=A0AB39HJN2_9VIBR|nr:histidinol-phosphate transaminase [Vibrio sp. HB161653]MDP5253076.1 histidinol-phosphate transaminase [Vibrio sp. HB161653]
MSRLIDAIVPESIKKLIPYQSARRIGGHGDIWLNANELEQAIAYTQDAGQYHRYPDFLPGQVAAAYQAYANTQAEVLAVRGADEAIDLITRAFCQPGKDKIAICTPTYAMYQFCAEASLVQTLALPLQGADFALPLEALIEASVEANVVFLCSPNNPTGQVLDKAQVTTLLEHTKEQTLVVIDEAYIEYQPDASFADLLEEYPNLVIIRTLSKAFGLAAVRCGFILANPEVMDIVKRLVPPYPMPDPSCELVLNALSEQGLTKMQTGVDSLIETRDWFAEQLSNYGFIERVYPSATNFVLVKTQPEFDLFDYLKQHGVVTRNQAHEDSLKHCVRITIGTRQTMQKVVDLIDQYTPQSQSTISQNTNQG